MFQKTENQHNFFFVFSLLLFLIVPIYFNILHASWHLDDSHAILTNSNVHLTTLSLDAVTQTFEHKNFFRPLPCLSFGLNWFFSKDNIELYHVTDCFIHLLTAFLLYLTVLALFQSVELKKRYDQTQSYSIAVVTAVLWAINPIQTQAVTYVVQRMAQMSACFYIAGILFFLKAKNSRGKKSWFYYFLTALFYSFSVLSKENGVLLIVSLFLIEAVFYTDVPVSKKRVKTFVLWFLVIIGAGTAGIIIFAGSDPLFFLNGYSYRPFSITERVLTETRVLCFYLSQIFYPVPSRLSIAHDIPVSHSLFDPVSTFFSLCFILFAVILSWYYRKKTPLLSFSILFFFINHSLESTVIPLELIFEHRNYLPSLFIFLPVAAGFCRIIHYYRYHNKIILEGTCLVLISVMISFGTFTYLRNKVWMSETSLWYDAVKKAPNNARAAITLAIELAWGEKVTRQKEEVALHLFNKALKLQKPRRLVDADIYGNLALLYARRNKTQKAVALIEKALAINPRKRKFRFDLITFLMSQGLFQRADKEADLLIASRSKNSNIPSDYYYIKGVGLLWLNKFDQALIYFQKALQKKGAFASKILAGAGYALGETGLYKRADSFYKLAQARHAKYTPMAFFLLIENSVKAKEPEKAVQYAKAMFSQFDIYTILKRLKTVNKTPVTVPVKKELIKPVIKQVFLDTGKEAIAKHYF